MLTVFVVLAVAAVLFAAAVVATQESDLLVDAPADGPDVELPQGRVVAEDLREVRFGMVFRGYRMAEVDDVLDRLGEQLAERDLRIAELEQALAHIVEPVVGEIEAQQAAAATDEVRAVVEAPAEPEPEPAAPAPLPPVLSFTLPFVAPPAPDEGVAVVEEAESSLPPDEEDVALPVASAAAPVVEWEPASSLADEVEPPVEPVAETEPEQPIAAQLEPEPTVTEPVAVEPQLATDVPAFEPTPVEPEPAAEMAPLSEPEPEPVVAAPAPLVAPDDFPEIAPAEPAAPELPEAVEDDRLATERPQPEGP